MKLSYDSALPITAHREDIVAAIRAHPVLVVAGETGSGKTTQLPKFCLEAGRGTAGLIGCTQPRRIAARAMAARVAEELGVVLGGLVGYQVRFRERIGTATQLKFMTDGILLAETHGDRLLRAYDTIIIDEAHERSLNIDFLLGYVKRLLPHRPDLRLVITSATIDTAKFARHFDNAPVVEVSGRGYPVETVYRPLDESTGEVPGRDLYRGIAEAVHYLDRIDRNGDILVFLSGEREIHEAREYLERAGLRHTEVLPLYARLSAAEQQRVFHPGPQRRIILSTNVAETSLTVPRIRFVIDSGFARISRYAHRSRIQRLPIEPVSRASADQRRGRCGRLGPGICVRLYGEEDFEGRPEFTEPEILRTSLASVILRMLTMGLGVVEDFPFVDPPAPRMINDAYNLLFELGAVDGAREPTPDGRKLARWPIDVRLGRMVLEGARLGCLEDLLVLAAGLSIQDPRERPLDAQEAADEAHGRFSDQRSDFVALLRLWQHLRQERRSRTGNQFRKLCRREFLNWQRVLEWFDLYQQLRDQAREERLPLTGGHGDFEQVHRALLSGLLSHVGQRHPENRSYLGARNRNFHIFPGSGLFGSTPQWIMAAEIVETTRPYARINAGVKPQWIEAQADHLLKRRHFDPHWSKKRGRVMAWEQVSLFGLVLAEKRRVAYDTVDPEEARRIFILEALVRGRLDTRAPFMDRNRRVRQEVELLEHKRRQRDVLVDEHHLSEFFDARVPADVNTARGFAAWLDSLDDEGMQSLHLAHDVLLREDAGQAPADLYPDHLQIAGQRFPLAYRFEPGHPADGVTVSLPLESLNLLDPGRAQWLVPGLLREKLVELMRTLPKPRRRVLTPLPQFADAALQRLGGPDSGPLVEALAAELEALTGAVVPAAEFDEGQIPDHLRLRVEVLGGDDEVLAAGRDIGALQGEYGQRARRRFMDRQGREFNRDGLVDWDCGALPEVLTTPSGAQAWPALVDQGDAAGLRLFDTPGEAAAAHWGGVLRLLALRHAEKLVSLHRHHGLAAEALLAWAPVGDANQLVVDLAWHSLTVAAGPLAATVRDGEAFRALLQEVRARIGPLFRQQARTLSEILLITAEIRRELDGGFEDRHPEAGAEMRAHLDDLVYPGFLLDLEADRLVHYPRYLEAIRVRLERLPQDPRRDARLAAQFAPFWSRYEAALASGREYDEALDRYRWMLHEFRVSVFAQLLGTAEKVSPKRLEGAWGMLD